MTQAQQGINAKAIGLAAGIIGLVAIIASLLATGYLSLKFLIQPQSTTIQNEITESIVTGITDVKAGEYESEEFQVPADASNAFVRGSFFANSGSVTDIKVMILDQADFARWQDGQEPDDPYYFSGQVTAADIEAKVPNDRTLYLVFDNVFSQTSDKRVEAELELAYLR